MVGRGLSTLNYFNQLIKNGFVEKRSVLFLSISLSVYVDIDNRFEIEKLIIDLIMKVGFLMFVEVQI